MYTLSLEQFEGPLDLLLHLIEKSKIDIKDIFVSEITEQYIEYIKANQADLDEKSEFLNMAATLLFIKSKRLLPSIPEEPDDEEDAELRLISQLNEYKLYKTISQEIQKYIDDAPAIFTKYPEEYPFEPQKYEIKNVTVEMLLKAFKKLQERIDFEEKIPDITYQKIVREEKYTITQKMDIIKDRLFEEKKVYFQQLFEEDNRADIIITFIAILELLHLSILQVHQSTMFGDILLTLN